MKKFIKLLLVMIVSAQVFGQSDNCATATTVTLSGGTACVNGTTTGATSNLTLYGGCNASSVNEVWYTFVATGSQNDFTITSLGLTNAEIIIDVDGCSNSSFETCNTVAGAATLNASWGIAVGTQVWIGIASNGGVEGNFDFCINSYNPAPSSGNTCAMAIPLCGSTYSVPTMAPFTASGQYPSCFLSAPQQDIWFEFTILAGGTFSWEATQLCTAEFDWALWDVTSGCPGTEARCNYNWSGGNSGTFGMVAGPGTCNGENCDPINVVAGEVYALQIDNYTTFNNCGFDFTWLGTAQIAPTASFTINPSSVTCGASVNVAITNTSVGTPDWTFGNGNSYTGTTPPNQDYSSPGTYAITATIPGDCPATATQFVQLYGPLSGTISDVDATCPSSNNGSASVTSVTGGDGIYTYLWSGPSQNGATTPSISGLSPGAYSVTISNATCGSSIVLNTTISVINTMDDASFTVNNYCEGSANSATVTGTPGGTFSFNPVPGGGVSINSSTGSITGGVGGTTYTVQYTTSGACPATSTQNVTVNAVGNPSFTFSNYCAGSANSATITGTPGGTFSFNPIPGGGETINSSTGSISGGIGGTTYTVQYTTPGACPASSTQNVTVNSNPVFSVSSSNPTSCGGTDGSITLSGLNNSVSYAVTYVDGGSTVGPTNYTSSGAGVITLSGLNAGTYNGFSLTLNSTGCNGTNATVVNLVDPGAPTLVISNPSAVCSPTTVNLTAPAVTAGSTAGTLSYWNDAGATSALASPAAVGTSGTYYIQLTNAGCSDIEAVVVTINQTPDLVITNPSAVCTPSTVDITAAAVTAGSTNPGTLSYWNDAGATSSLSGPTALSTSGTYYIQGINAGCTDINPVVVTINATPNLVITNPTAVCSPSTVDITAASVTSGSTNPGTLSYWNDAGATSSLLSPSTVNTSGTYYIQATNSGCTDISPVTVTINTTPVLVITDPSAVCSPSTVDITAATVTAGSTNPGTLSYWNDAGASSSLSSPSTISVSGTYYIQGTNSGCTDIQAVIVTINSTPNLIITDPSAVCLPLTVDITAASVTSGSTNVGTLSYWNDAAASSSLSNPSTLSIGGTYYIQATNSGCTDIAPVTVNVNSIPLAPNAGINAVYCASWTMVPMTASGSGGTYTWYTDAATTNMIGTGTTLMPGNNLNTTNYYVTETVFGCEGPASIVSITINNCNIIVPTAFTPDNDNTNEVWEIVDLDAVYPDNVVTVYNRWGNVVYESDKGAYAARPWDGTFKGEALPVESFYFIIDFNNEDVEPQKGIVSIILN